MKIRVLLGTCLLSIASGAVHALGLGEILVNSRLNQPLDAEILVRESVPGEAEQLVAKLASQEDFARVGLERARMPTLLRFETAKNARGQTIIRVRSDEPIREPFLTLLVEANWSGGRLLREYGVLLDPPVAAPASRIARTQPPAAAPAQTAPLPPTTPAEPVAATPAPAPARPAQPAPTPAPPPASAAPPQAAQPASRPPPGFAPPGRPAPASPPSQAASPPPAVEPEPAPAAAPPADQDGRYTVQPGDTLSGVASQHAADVGVTVNQMMLALQRNNPDAFFADNINALKAGAVLRIPDAADARTLTVVEASTQVRGQIESWTGTTLADAGAAPVRATTPAAAPASDRLELLPPSADAPGSDAAGRAGSGQGGAAVAEVQAELQRTREDLTSRNQELSELNSRVRDLEELNTKNARLLELKDGEIAELQRRLAEATAAAAQPAAPVADAAAPPPAETAPAPATGAETPAAAEDPAAAAGPTADAQPATPEGADTPPLAEGIPETGEADPAAAAAEPPAQDEESWEAGTVPEGDDAFADTEESGTTADTLTPAPAPSEPATPATQPPPAAQPAVTTTAPATTPAEQPWYMQPLYQGAAVLVLALLALIALLARRKRKAPETEVEAAPKRSVADLFGASPMAAAAADVAAGSDANDEALALQAQIARNPDDHGAYLELLSLYYAEGDGGRFAEWAERMSERPGSRASIEWDQVRSMGEEMLPDHPLFAAASSIAAATAPTPTARPAWLDEVQTRHEPASAAPPPPSPAPEPEAPAKRVYDLSGTEFKLDEPFESAIEEEADPIEYQLDEIEPVEATPPVTPAPRAAVRDEGEASLPPLMFDDEDLAPATPAFAGTRAADADEPEGMDDAATKLELARAYLDMGDPEGARAMLEEVLGEGDTSQREEARKLLAVL